MSLESNLKRAPGAEQVPTQPKTTNQLAEGDYIVEYAAHLVRKFGRANQVVLVLDDNPKLERLVDADEEFHVS
jgi:hypothetical protein